MKTDKAKMYGAEWCPDAQRAKKWMLDNNFPFDWFDIDQSEEAARIVRENNNGRIVVPTIILPDGSILVEPSNEELANKIRKS